MQPKNGIFYNLTIMNTTKIFAVCVSMAMSTAMSNLSAQEYQTTANSDEYNTFDKYRIGGYGEMLFQAKDYTPYTRWGGNANGSTKESKSYISLPRMVLAGDYKFNSKWILGMEIEFEAGGVGVETELEQSENGEYETEMEKGGEVALEQFHITRLINRYINVRVGHMVLPVGLTNAHHEPINFFGTMRPEGETTIIPSTWHETGLQVFGTLGDGYATFDYQAMVVAGLNPDGFGRDAWVADGKQGLFEADNFTSPAWVARVDYRGVPGLRIGGSIYYVNDVTRNADKSYKYSSVGASSLTIWSADLQYKNRYVTVRGNVMGGNLDNASAIGKVTLSNQSNYHSGSMRRNIAQGALAWGIEAGLNCGAWSEKAPTIYPFVRYEYFNTQEKSDGGIILDDRCKVGKLIAGVNWFALPNLVVKADYSNRRIGAGNYNSENEFAIGVAYVGWFSKK